MKKLLELVVVSLSVLLVSCSSTKPGAIDLLITDLVVYPAPGEQPLTGVDIAVNGGRIVGIGENLPVSSDRTVDAAGRVATAGLWNSHIHLMDPRAATHPKEEVQAMLLQYGFTGVLDTGSDPGVTAEIVSAIESGEMPGPRILRAGGGFVYTDATPAYLPGAALPEIDDPGKADQMVAEVMSTGADGIKIFAGSFMSPTVTIHIPPEIIAAISAATHKRGGFLVAHPNDWIGLINSVENGVDILAHTVPQPGVLSADLIETMKQNDVALVPTLALWSYEFQKGGVPGEVIAMMESTAEAQLADYYHAGGEVLFGTDVGYMRDFNPERELALMRDAGMDFDGILASLTTNPAERFTDESGRLEVGGPANITVFSGNPAADVTGFSRVQYTIRAGRFLFCADEGLAGSPCR